MHSYSFIFFDKDTDMEEKVEDTVNPPNWKMLAKQIYFPVLAKQLTGQRKAVKSVMEEKKEKEEVRMDKVMRKPWNYGTSIGRKTL